MKVIIINGRKVLKSYSPKRHFCDDAIEEDIDIDDDDDDIDTLVNLGNRTSTP
jgi:hypothetical protein